MSFLKISDPAKRDLNVKEHPIYSAREPENNNYKPIFQSFISLLLKRKKLQRGRLRKDLSLLNRV